MSRYRPPSRTFTGLANEARLLCDRFTLGAIDRDAFLEACARMTNSLVGCSRTGIWAFVDLPDGRVLRCLAMYDAVADRMTRVPDEKREVQPYLEALEREGFIDASDAHLHPATTGLLSTRPAARTVRSLLASSFAVNGHLFGAFTCTQIGERREWTPRQLATLRQIGAPASLALYRASRSRIDLGAVPALV